MTRTLHALTAAAALFAAGHAAAQTPPDYTGDLNALPSAASPPTPRPQVAQQTPVVEPPSPAMQAPPPSPQPTAAAPVSSPSVPASPRALTRAEIEALPFSVTLPDGYELTAGRPGPDFQVWTVRKAGLAQLMIYAGPASQFPIHDGEMVVSGGRTTVVVVEEGRRRALEHLFRQSVAPLQIHVWVASVEGADRDRAEAIGHGVSPR